MPGYDDDVVSDKELERRLREGEVDTKDLPTPPSYIIMEDEQPERFAQLMSEGRPDGMESIDPTMKALLELPDKLAERLGAD